MILVFGATHVALFVVNVSCRMAIPCAAFLPLYAADVPMQLRIVNKLQLGVCEWALSVFTHR